MLKNEHLDFRIRADRVHPLKIDRSKVQFLECAARLIALYEGAVASRMRRGELQSLIDGTIKSSFVPKVAAGFDKLLSERTEFAPAAEVDYPEVRRKAFLASAALLKAGITSPEKLHEASPLPENCDLYGDLADFEELRALKPITAEALLNRYDLAQAQGLLLHSEAVCIHVRAAEAGGVRQLLKAVKFFRLLAKITMPAPGSVTIEISGPFALFGAGTKYAMLLAALLPAVVKLREWKLEAEVTVRNRKVRLKLDQSAGYVSHYRSFSSYIPEEIRLYHRFFAEKAKSWQIVGETPFIDAGNQEIIFPDLSFREEASGKVVHLELFHRWHRAALESRLQLLAGKPEIPLLLGIDRALVKDDGELAALTENYHGTAERCWLFRDFPGVENTLRALKRFVRAI